MDWQAVNGLGEGKTWVIVGLEDLRNGRDKGGSPKVYPEIVLYGSLHDGLKIKQIIIYYSSQTIQLYSWL